VNVINCLRVSKSWKNLRTDELPCKNHFKIGSEDWGGGMLRCMDGCLLVTSACGESNDLEKGGGVHTVLV
jgi:hypothetical protein